MPNVWYRNPDMEAIIGTVEEIVLPIVMGLLCVFKTFGPFTISQNLFACAPKAKNKALFPLVKEAEIRRWSPVLLIGPLPVALLGTLVITLGQLIFFTMPTTPSDPCVGLRSSFIRVLCVAYLFVFVFFWSYCGYTYDLAFEFRGRPRKIAVMRPFPSLGHLIACYLDLFLIGVGIMGAHTAEFAAAVQSDPSCGAVGMVGFSFVIVVLFWIMATQVIRGVLKAAFGKEEQGLSLAQSQALKAKKEAERKAKEDAEDAGLDAPKDDDDEDGDKSGEMTAAEKNAAEIKKANEGKLPLAMQADATESLGMQAVREQFMVIGNMDEISSPDLEELLLNLRIRLPETEVDDIKEKLDLEGIITFDLFYEWYKDFYAAKRGEGPTGPVDKSKKAKEEAAAKAKAENKKSWFGGKKKAEDKYDASKGDAPPSPDKPKDAAPDKPKAKSKFPGFGKKKS